MPKRVLLLGPTGTDKRAMVEALIEAREQTDGALPLEYIDFEKEYAANTVGGMPDYLDVQDEPQRQRWLDGWRNLILERADSGHDLVVGLHSVLTRPLYGSRSPIFIPQVEELELTHVVTAIDDVYMQWHRTHLRAGRRTWIGQPTLSQLIDARRAELVIGDLIASHVGGAYKPGITNWLIAARHPVRLLERLLFGDPPPRPIYLSFPISKPREMARAGDDSGLREVEEFLRDTAEFERAHEGMVSLCPLSIDELPAADAARRDKNDDEPISIDMIQRWDPSGFWGESERLMTGPLPSKIEIPNGELLEAEGMIRADVAVRDYRLYVRPESSFLSEERILPYIERQDGQRHFGEEAIHRYVDNVIAQYKPPDEPLSI